MSSVTPRDGCEGQYDLDLEHCLPAAVGSSDLSPAVPSPIFDTYWRFASERQAVFLRRFKNESPPWTVDHIIRDYKFTNVYRAADRVSQYLIREVIYSTSASPAPQDTFFRIILFKLFNKIETWELLKREFGEPSVKDFRFQDYDRVLTKALEAGKRVYSAAYIMPSGVTSFGNSKKHRNHLLLLDKMVREDLAQRVCDARSMRDVFTALLSYPTIGPFLAYQLAIDINYSPLTDFSENSFVVPGPGALSGIKKCFLSLGGLTEADIIRLMVDIQKQEFARLSLSFQNLFGRQLHLIDCQNLFCEVDKYSRVAHPTYLGSSNRTRIKQMFRASEQRLNLFFPPKWGIIPN